MNLDIKKWNDFKNCIIKNLNNIKTLDNNEKTDFINYLKNRRWKINFIWLSF